MMNRLAWLGAPARIAMSACTIDLGGPDEDAYGSRRPNLECAPEGADWDRVSYLYDATEQSVHELITCGGLQVGIATDIVLMLITSNEDLFKDEERELIEGFRYNPFTQRDDGTWEMQIPDSADSRFAMTFYDPSTREPIIEDVFDLDSYLQGVHIQTEVGLAEMLEDPSKKWDYVYTYDGEGPLAHLMNGGEPLPEGGFTLSLSIRDLLYAEPEDLGPFQSVFAVEVDSEVDYVDARYGADIRYRVRTLRDDLAAIADTQSLDFEVESITGVAGELTLAGDASNLQLIDRGSLAGQIEYVASGTLERGEVDILVQSDFGEGQAYPATEWRCR